MKQRKVKLNISVADLRLTSYNMYQYNTTHVIGREVCKHVKAPI